MGFNLGLTTKLNRQKMEDGPDVEVDESAGAGISKQVNKV